MLNYKQVEEHRLTFRSCMVQGSFFFKAPQCVLHTLPGNKWCVCGWGRVERRDGEKRDKESEQSAKIFLSFGPPTRCVIHHTKTSHNHAKINSTRA